MRSIGLLCLGIVSVFILGCSGKKATGETAQKEAVAIESVPVEQGIFPLNVKAGGTLKGDRQTKILAKVMTTVLEIPVKRGRMVNEGDILIKLDPDGVQSNYRQSEAVYLNSERQFKKMEALYNVGAISEREFENTATDFKVAQANFDATRQSIVIEAPFSGIVTDVYVRVGDEVSSGMPLVEVADVSALRLPLEVPTSQFGEVRTGQPVTVTSPVDSASTMDGNVREVADAISQTTRSFEAECRFPQPLAGFMPGMYVVADIKIRSLENALIVPNDAILYRGGHPQIYVCDADTVGLVKVNVLAENAGKVAVDGPLKVGQKVVVVGQKNLTPGALVREAEK